MSAADTVLVVVNSLIFEGFGSKLGKRVQDVLKYIFPVPKCVVLDSPFSSPFPRDSRYRIDREDAKRTMTFVNEGDFISFRHHVFVKTSHKEVQLAEVGPRFEMRRAYRSLSLSSSAEYAR